MSVRQSVFALVDCNNFFVSCERVFRPDLWNKPVVVLSNNDGVLVARSNEVKEMGIPMAVPYFKVRDVLTKNNVTLFSGNFPLYGDFSQRVVQILQSECPDIEVYSVDESFLEISHLPIRDYTEWGRQLRSKILQWTGIPVSVGIAPTKTLAKAAADYTKKHINTDGAFSVVGDDQKRIDLLQWLPLQDIWGVGWRTAPKLKARGIKNAYDLSRVSDAWAQEQLTIRGVKTIHELQGESCLGLEQSEEPQQSIARTRSFGHNVRNYYELEGAVATFAAKAAVKLRQEGELAGAVVTFMQTSKHAEVQRSSSQLIQLHPPSDETGKIIEAALQALEQIYDPEFGYRRAGVILFDLRKAQQLAFDSDPEKLDRNAALMQTIDDINKRFGTRLVRHASEHIENHKWHSKRELRSHAYTTNWRELPVVRAGQK
jgi:DNA polymerase V